MIKFFISISKLINKLPFCGKIAIREATLNLYSSRGEKKYFITVIILLLLMIIGHGGQAFIGLIILKYAEKFYVKIICTIYSATNISVAYTQIVILLRASMFAHKHRNQKNYKKVKYQGYKFLYQALCIFITLGGQIIFLVASSQA
ncbi:MAG: hypothetical protein QMB51_02890 [Patescibacteria group bacterium]